MIPDPRDSRTGLRPLPVDRLVTLFVQDEGVSAATETMRFIEEHPSGLHERSFNVWYLDIDTGLGTVAYDHDFDPYQGVLPLEDFTRELRAHLAREQP